MKSDNEHPVFVRGKAAVCALGDQLDAIVAGMRNATINMTHIAFELIDAEVSRPYYLMPADFRDRWPDAESRFSGVMLETVEAAVADSGLSAGDLEEAGIFFGSTSMNIPIFEATYQDSGQDGRQDGGQDGRQDGRADVRESFNQTCTGYGVIAAQVAERFGIHGPCHTFTTACTSSANGLLYAAAMIAQGQLEHALVIGYDMFNLVGYYGFESLKLLSPTGYRPFDRERDGIIMGEGCGAVLLTNRPGSANDIRILGGANVCDTSNVALHNTNGEAIAGVMKAAMADARIETEQVAAVKAHATGSFHNDLTEANAIRMVFGQQSLPVTGLKPFIGHTVGAGGVLELILFSEAVRAGFLPPTPGFREADPELGLSPLAAPEPIGAGTFMLNYFGFGGNCTTLIISNED